MADHNKPTKEELEEAQKKALEAEPSVEPSEPAPSEPAPSEPEPSEPVEPSEPAPSQADPSKELYKKKFSESSRENQKINAKNRVINKALADAGDVPEPTEDDLVKEYPDWDEMSDIEKTLAKETVISRNWRQMISQAKQQAEKIEKWNESVDEYIDDPKTLNDNSDLEGKTDEFRDFAKQESNNNVPFNILIGAFLHQQSTEKKDNKGRMFERGSGGSNEKPQGKSNKLNLEESRKLRETDYNKGKQYLKEGKIEISV
jgi:hypothetical protein